MRAAASVVKTISTEKRVVGMTTVGHKVFVLLSQRKNQVAVYSTEDYRPLCRLNVPGYTPGDSDDITSCAQNQCLYMSDIANRCIHRYDLAKSRSTKWPVSGKPVGLSLTPGGRLLVTTVHDGPKLVEMSARSGRRVREIALQSDMVSLTHGVQLPSGQFVVCRLDRVCAVGDDGKVTHNYVDSTMQRVDHLAVDKDSQFIFAADRGNHRVVLLTPTLEWVRDFKGLSLRARRLYFHRSTKRLFVGQSDGVNIIQL